MYLYARGHAPPSTLPITFPAHLIPIITLCLLFCWCFAFQVPRPADWFCMRWRARGDDEFNICPLLCILHTPLVLQRYKQQHVPAYCYPITLAGETLYLRIISGSLRYFNVLNLNVLCVTSIAIQGVYLHPKCFIFMYFYFISEYINLLNLIN